MSDVLVSYKREDELRVSRLIRALQLIGSAPLPSLFVGNSKTKPGMDRSS